MTAPLGAVWLGHATTLLRLGRRWILTDPVFSARIGMRVGPFTLGLPRLAPAVDPRSLPPIDVVLISHAHFDHLDRPSLRTLATLNPGRTRVVTAAGTRSLIPAGFADVTELPWDQSIEMLGVTLRAIKPRHWGARTVWDRHRGYNSYLLSTPEASILYAGDTALCESYDHLARVGGVDLSIFGIGAYDPWIENHASPEQVWQMHSGAMGRRLMPIHHSTFELSDEPLDEPMKRLLAVAGAHRDRIVAHELGMMYVPSSGEA